VVGNSVTSKTGKCGQKEKRLNHADGKKPRWAMQEGGRSKTKQGQRPEKKTKKKKKTNGLNLKEGPNGKARKVKNHLPAGRNKPRKKIEQGKLGKKLCRPSGGTGEGKS